MANFHFSYKVCECKKVTLGEIMYAIKEKDAKTMDDVKKMTDAGTACGCCRSASDDFGNPKMKLYIEEILKKLV